MDLARFPLGDPPDYELGPEKSVRAIAACENRAPKEVAYGLLLENNGKGLMQQVEGYDYTVCSGQVTFKRGEATDAMPGRLIRVDQSA